MRPCVRDQSLTLRKTRKWHLVLGTRFGEAHPRSPSTAASHTRLGLLRGGKIRVGVFPKSLWAASARTRAAPASAPGEAFACSAFAPSTLRCANAPSSSSMTMPLVDDLLKLGGASVACPDATYASPTGVEAGEIVEERNSGGDAGRYTYLRYPYLIASAATLSVTNASITSPASCNLYLR